MNLSEKLYILYRRAKAVMGWSVYLVCSIFPIRRNKIVFSAFEGGGYGCNPKYIAEELIRRMHEEGKVYEMVWLVNDVTKKFPKEITPVKIPFGTVLIICPLRRFGWTMRERILERENEKDSFTCRHGMGRLV